MPKLSPELHSYLVAAVTKYNADQRNDPRWLKDKVHILATYPTQRSARENSLLSSDMIMERLHLEARALLDEWLEAAENADSAGA